MSSTLGLTMDSLYESGAGTTQLALLSVVILLTLYYLFFIGKSSHKQDSSNTRSVITPTRTERPTSTTNLNSTLVSDREVCESSVDSCQSASSNDITTTTITSTTTTTTTILTALSDNGDGDQEDKLVPDNVSDISTASVDSDSTAVGTFEQVSTKVYEHGGLKEKEITVEQSLVDSGNDDMTLCLTEQQEDVTECNALGEGGSTGITKEENQQTVSQSVTENLKEDDADQLDMKESTNNMCNLAAPAKDDEFVEQPTDTSHCSDQVLQTTFTPVAKQAILPLSSLGQDEETLDTITTKINSSDPVTLVEDEAIGTTERSIIPGDVVEDMAANTTERSIIPGDVVEDMAANTTEIIYSNLATVVEDKATDTTEVISSDPVTQVEDEITDAIERSMIPDDVMEDMGTDTTEGVSSDLVNGVEDMAANTTEIISYDSASVVEDTATNTTERSIIPSAVIMNVDNSLAETDPHQDTINDEMINKDNILETSENGLVESDDINGEDAPSGVESTEQVEPVEPTKPVNQLEPVDDEKVSIFDQPANEPASTTDESVDTSAVNKYESTPKDATTYPVTMIPFTRANPLNKPKREMSRVERIEQQRQSYIPLYKSRCTYWPGCSNHHCKYWHPFIECRNGETCQFGKKCVFLHPRDYQTQQKGTSKKKTKGTNKAAKATATPDHTKTELT
ncbi:hypothetical protein BC941DRAFT_431817 [Chlamydoabsidia padenii]|nr:hypothetical protein BC941DRAFT_431817 [Chlamydoabsidia padenii]